MKRRIHKNNNSKENKPGKSNNKNTIKSINEKIDRYTKKIYEDLRKQGVKDIRKLDILVYLFSDKYINVIANNKLLLEITARKHISGLIEDEMRTLLEQKVEENKELGFSEIEILDELRNLDCSTEVLNVQVPSDKIVTKLQKCVNKFIDEKMEKLDESEIESVVEIKTEVETEPEVETKIEAKIEPKILSEVKLAVEPKTELVTEPVIEKEKTFIEKVREYTDDFKFLTTDIPRHSAERGHYKATKFESLEDYFEFKKIQDKLNSNKHGRTTELESINSVLRFNNLTKEQREIITKRKQVLLNDQKTR